MASSILSSPVVARQLAASALLVARATLLSALAVAAALLLGSMKIAAAVLVPQEAWVALAGLGVGHLVLGAGIVALVAVVHRWRVDHVAALPIAAGEAPEGLAALWSALDAWTRR